MQKKLLVAVITLLTGIILAFWWLNETAAQIISIAITLSVLAIILALNIERPGMLTVLLLSPSVLTGLCKQLGNTQIGAKAGEFLTQVAAVVYNKIGIQELPQIKGETALIIFFWVVFSVVVLLTSKFGQTAMGVHQGKACLELQEKNFSKRSQAFCVSLHQQLERINTETDWNESYFTSVQAEVEVIAKGKHKKKYMDLLTCLKKNRQGTVVFLVLGDPGSGKSVSLRKLCLDLLRESKTTKKIPLYINLKKWREDWNLDRLPQTNDLISFIKKTIREDGDMFVDEFLNDFFDKMLEDGRWYFVFDSFDEMPCLMGRKNYNELINHISQLLHQFLTASNQSGGIIASRLYRAPFPAVKATKILRIQEFSDIKIHKTLDNYLSHADEVSKMLFGYREDLVALCRNPFYLSLISSYIKEKGGQLPQNQMHLYTNFVEGRLKKCAGKLEEKNLTMQDVHNAAKQLALYLQDSPQYGLECPVQKLYELNGGKDWVYWQKSLEVLEYAKLCRMGGPDKTVSFIHRRFQEFFLVESILEHRQDVGEDVYKDIIHNTGMRDALVLYCEVSEKEQAQEIAEYCWKILQESKPYKKNIQNPEAVMFTNTLCFMTEAFRNRTDALSKFLNEFQQMVIDCVSRETDFVVLQALTNSMALLGQDEMQKAILKVFQVGNSWLNDTVVKNCRLIHQLNYQLEMRFATYFLHMDFRTFLERFVNTHFSLSLSKNFRYIRTVHICLFLRYVALLLSLLLYVAMAVRTVPNLSTNVTTILQLWESVGTVDEFLKPFFWPASPNEIPFTMILLAIVSSIPYEFDLIFMKKIGYIKTTRDNIKMLLFSLLDLLLNATVLNMCFHWISIIPSIFVYASVSVLLIMLLSSRLISLIHDAYFMVANIHLSLAPLLIFFAFVMIHITFMLVLWIIRDFLARFIMAFVAILSGCVVILVLVVLFLMLIRYAQDWLWLRRRPNIKQVKRAQLEKDLSALHSRKWKRHYAEQLLDNKVKLVGDWPNGYRPSYGDDSLERILAQLDCIDLPLNSSF